MARTIRRKSAIFNHKWVLSDLIFEVDLNH